LILEALFIVKVMEVPVPDVGTLPVPVHPVHLNRVLPDWSAGLATEAVIVLPESNQLLCGKGEP
jgi:hypothetical protein